LAGIEVVCLERGGEQGVLRAIVNPNWESLVWF